MDLTNLKTVKMDVKVLGTGCSKCKKLEKLTQDAITELELDAVLEKVEDIQKIMAYGIMQTPGLVINEKVVLSGKLPKLNEIKDILKNNA